MLDAELGKKDDREFAATYCSYFEAPLPGKFLEPVLVELIPGGSKIPVTAGRVHEYVRYWALGWWWGGPLACSSWRGLYSLAYPRALWKERKN